MSAGESLPDGLLLAWYGDDFTGASAVMEVLTFAGLDSVLFLDAPTPAQRARFPDARAIGIAGIARSQGTDWMARELPSLFRAIAALGAPVNQYKVCSTFDSSPAVGSIGRAIEIGLPIFGGSWLPLLPAAPPIRRYQAFGNLFASVGETTYRLDRHPTMSRHPVTPMTEADVRVHLARQTDLRIGLTDLLAMKAGRAADLLAEELGRGARIVALDVVDDETLREAGRLMWEQRGDRLFAIGSQGVEYALIAYWRAAGLLPAAGPRLRADPAERLVVASGSCSPLTAQQIAWAEQRGFRRVAIDAGLAVSPEAWRWEMERALGAALRLIGEGRDPIFATAAGPDDPAVAAFRDAVAAAGAHEGVVNARIGDGLGRLVDQVIRRAGVRRALIAGGDTSGHATRALDLFALTAIAEIAPGAPLCQAHSEDAVLDGLTIALKGGQMGGVDYFGRVKEGGAAA